MLKRYIKKDFKILLARISYTFMYCVGRHRIRKLNMVQLEICNDAFPAAIVGISKFDMGFAPLQSF
jgi:hypothetical protein